MILKLINICKKLTDMDKEHSGFYEFWRNELRHDIKSKNLIVLLHFFSNFLERHMEPTANVEDYFLCVQFIKWHIQRSKYADLLKKMHLPVEQWERVSISGEIDILHRQVSAVSNTYFYILACYHTWRLFFTSFY